MNTGKMRFLLGYNMKTVIKLGELPFSGGIKIWWGESSGRELFQVGMRGEGGGAQIFGW